MVWMLTLMLAGAEPALAGRKGTSSIPAPADRPTLRNPEGMLSADWRRVRAMDGRIQEVVAAGVRRSGTFRALVAALQATDVIVYVEATFGLPPETAGRLLLVAVTGEGRYLRAQVRATLRPDEMIATIAHELRHALEVAEDRAVLDNHALSALYRRIGRQSLSTHGYETQAAIEAAEAVRDELTGRRPPGRPVAAGLDRQGPQPSGEA